MTLKQAIAKIPSPDEMGRRVYESQRSTVVASVLRIPEQAPIRYRPPNAKD